MLFSRPRRVAPFGSTVLPLFEWGVHRHTAVVLSDFYCISLVRNALLPPPVLFVHTWGVGTAAWYE